MAEEEENIHQPDSRLSVFCISPLFCLFVSLLILKRNIKSWKSMGQKERATAQPNARALSFRLLRVAWFQLSFPRSVHSVTLAPCPLREA